MTQLTNGQHACVLVFLPMVYILNIYLVTVNLFSLYLINFMFHITLDAVGNILRVHYKTVKYDVSFSQDSLSMLFDWGEHVMRTCYSCMCKNVLPVYSRAKIIKKSDEFFQSYDHKCTATFFYESQCTYADAAYCYRWSSEVCLSWSSAWQKQLNRLRCCLGCGLGCAQGTMY